MPEITFELCAETAEACLAAVSGGAHRIELCSVLREGGVTPSHGLMRLAIERGRLPVHVLVRPRGGDFVYSSAEFDVMLEDVLHAKATGAAGVVFGLLHSDGTVDIDRTRTLMEHARPLQTTFHRAFDATASLTEALEAIIALGFDRVLTSGGAPDVATGSAQIASLVVQADGRIVIAAGGGLTVANAATIAQSTGTTHFHGSLRTDTLLAASPDQSEAVARAIRDLIDQLRTGVGNS